MSNFKFMTQYLSCPPSLSSSWVEVVFKSSVLCVCRTGKCSSPRRSPRTPPWPRRRNQRASKSCRKKRLLPSRPSEPLSPRLDFTPEVNHRPAALPAFLFPRISPGPPGLIFESGSSCFKRKSLLCWWSLTLNYANEPIMFAKKRPVFI